MGNNTSIYEDDQQDTQENLKTIDPLNKPNMNEVQKGGENDQSKTDAGKKEAKDEEEEFKPNKDSYCTLKASEVEEPKLTLLDLKNLRMQNLYNKEIEEFKQNVALAKKEMDPKAFKFDLLVCFWLTIHLQALEFARVLLEQDPLLEKLITSMRKAGKVLLAKEKERQFLEIEDDAEKVKFLAGKVTNENLKRGLLSKLFKKEEQTQDEASLDERQAKKKKKVQESLLAQFQEELIVQIEGRTGLKNEEDFQDVLFLLKGEHGQIFNTNIMRIALNMQEEKIASLIIAFYDSKVDDEMVLRAVKTQQLTFLHTMFLYNKNYEELMSQKKFQKILEAASVDNDPEAIKAAAGARFKVFTFDYIIKKNIDYGEEMGKQLVEQIAQWHFKSSENIIKALLKNNMDDIAMKHVLDYLDYVDGELISFCISNNNENFLKHCLNNGIYTTIKLARADIIDEVLRILEAGCKSELVLNVIGYMDLMRWSRAQLKKFIKLMRRCVIENYEQNPITVSYNPILLISLTCEQLIFLEENFLSLRHECRIVHKRLLALGDKILDFYDDENLSKIFLDCDFRNRTLLKIITSNGFFELFANYKVGVILEEIWQGRPAFNCDGDFADISLMTHLFKIPFKRIKNQRIHFKDLIFSGFNYASLKEQKYNFQYQVRTNSIDFIFKKDAFFAFGMVFVFQLINFTYLSLFRADNFINYGPIATRSLVQENINQYNQVNFLGTIFSSGLVFSIIAKIFFNCFATKKLVFDTWTMIDLVSAGLNLFCFNVIGSVTVDQILDRTQKQVLDYYVICVTVASWLRFFSYFFLVQLISKMMHTLKRMLIDTMSFIFLSCCYFLIMSTIFTLLFQVPDPYDYGSLGISFKTLFIAFIGEYFYFDEYPNYAMSYQILIIIHIFLSHIFLMNYLIAILSTVYSYMNEVGEFEFRVNKYNFIEKYSIPMLELGYKELVVHPPPVNFFTIPLYFGVFSRTCMNSIGPQFSKFIFWLENIPFIFGFMIYELALVPIVYVKQIVNFAIKVSPKQLLPLLSLWIILGPVVLIVVGFIGDVLNLFRVLCDDGSIEERQRIKVEDEFSKDKVILYNEMMDVMRAIMHIYKKKEEEEKGRRRKLLLSLQKKGKEQTAADFLDQNFLAQDLVSQGYLLDKKDVKQAWAKYRPESAQNTPREGEPQKPPQDRTDLNQVFGRMFIDKLLRVLKQRLYQAKNQFNFDELKKRHKNQLLQRKLNTNGNKEREQEVRFRNDFINMEKEYDEDPLMTRNIPQQELMLVDEFLQKFIFIADGASTNKDQVDINLILKSLPARIDQQNLYRVEMLGFARIQKALISFQNDDQDELFTYYDNRSKQRLRKLNGTAVDTDQQSEIIKDISQKLLNVVNTMLKRTGYQVSQKKGQVDVEDELEASQSGESRFERKRSLNKRNSKVAMSPTFNPRHKRSPTVRDEEKKIGNNVSFDDMPIMSNYALRQQKAARRYSKSPKNNSKSPPNQANKSNLEDINVGHLYMYLPQGMRFDKQTGFAPQTPREGDQKKEKTKKAKEEKATRFKPANVYYHQDYSDFQFSKESQPKTETTTKRQPMRSIVRPTGVNFKVELNDSPGIKAKAGGHIKTIQKHLQKLGVRYDLMKEYLDLKQSSSKANLNGPDQVFFPSSEMTPNNAHSQTQLMNIENQLGRKSPEDSLYLFSEAEMQEVDMSPTHHLRHQINLPPPDLYTNEISMGSLHQALIPERAPAAQEMSVTYEDEEAPSLGRQRDGSIDLTRQQRSKHRAPKVQWSKHSGSFLPVFD